METDFRRVRRKILLLQGMQCHERAPSGIVPLHHRNNRFSRRLGFAIQLREIVRKWLVFLGKRYPNNICLIDAV